MRRNQRRNTVLIIQGKTVCPQTTEGNHKEVTDQRKTSTCYLLSLSELSLVLRCLWRFILTHPKEEKTKRCWWWPSEDDTLQGPASSCQFQSRKGRIPLKENFWAQCMETITPSLVISPWNTQSQFTFKGRKTKPKGVQVKWKALCK